MGLVPEDLETSVNEVFRKEFNQLLNDELNKRGIIKERLMQAKDGRKGKRPQKAS